jgi:hypothetical protein
VVLAHYSDTIHRTLLVSHNSMRMHCGLQHTWAITVVFVSTRKQEVVLQKGTNMDVALNRMLLWMQSFKIYTNIRLIPHVSQ